MVKKAGLLFDHSPHYLDHLAPFCALAEWPLIVAEPDLAEQARQLYPDLEVIEKSVWDIQLPPVVVACDPKALIQAAFPGQAFECVWLPHGHSDKGAKIPFFEALAEESALLLYGQKIEDALGKNGASIQRVRVGHFRAEYYFKNRSFYQSLPRWAGTTFLYAPTWDDAENNNSFWKAFPRLAERV